MEIEVKSCDLLTDHKERVWCVAWNLTGDSLASCGGDRTIKIWQKSKDENKAWSCKVILTDGHTRTIRSLAWSPCGRYLASASFDATIAIWKRDGLRFECIASLEGHENEVKCVAWSRCGTYLASCGRDKSVWVWEVDEQEEFECVSVMNAHTQDVKKVIWHPEDKILTSASYDDTIKMYVDDGDDWITNAVLESHESTVWAVSYDRSGDRLISCSDDRTLKIWQRNSNGGSDEKRQWLCTCTLSGYHSRPIYDVHWCPLTNLIATACADNCIRLFRESEESTAKMPSYRMVRTLTQAHSDDVNSVAWNPKIAGCLASAADDGTIRIWQFDVE